MKIHKVFVMALLCLIVTKVNANDWQKTSYMENLKVFEIFKTENRLIIGTNRGIWYSDDAGATWTESDKSFSAVNVTTMAIDSVGNIFAVVPYRGLMKSTDKGESWSQIDNYLPKMLFVHPNGDIYASSSVLYRSYDNCSSKERLPWSNSDVGFTALTVCDDGEMYIAQSPRSSIKYGKDTVMSYRADIYSSKDTAQTWEKTDAGSDFASFSGVEYLVRSKEDALFAFSQMCNDLSMKPKNSNLWQRRSIKNDTLITPVAMCSDRYKNLWVLSKCNRLFMTDDNGDTWTEYPVEKEYKYITQMKYIGNNMIAITSGYNGISIFDIQNHTWKHLDVKFSNPDVLTLAISKNNTIMAGTDGSGLLVSSDNGNSWKESELGRALIHVNSIGYNPANDITIINTSVKYQPNSNKSYYSKDCNHWTEILGLDSSIAINHLKFIDEKIYAFNTKSIYYTDDVDSAWNKRDIKLDSGIVYAVEILDDKNFLVGTSTGEIYHSSDEGISWSMNNEKLPGIIKSFKRIGENMLIAGVFEQGVYLSNNNGQTWTKTENNQFGKYPQTFFADGNGTCYIAFVVAGLFKSTDYGESWDMYIESPVPPTGAYPMMTLTGDIDNQGNLFIGTMGGYGVLKSEEPIFGNSGVLEEELELSISPNPAQDYLYVKTNLDFTAQIFDYTGNIVQESIEKRIDISGLSSGVYIIQFEINNTKFTQKFIKE